MNFLNLIHKQSKFFYLNLTVFAIINSVLASSILYFINARLNDEEIPYIQGYDFYFFAAVIIISLIVSYRFENYMINITERIGVDLQKYIFEYLSFSDYERYVELKEEKVRTALHDVGIIQEIPFTYVAILNSAILILIGIAYLLWTNFLPALMLFFFIGLTVAYFVYQLRTIRRDKWEIRNLNDVYIRIINDFLRGFREIKMSTKRNNTIFSDYLMQNLERRMVVGLRFMSKFILNKILGKYAIYITIGVILFALPQLNGFDSKTMTSFITTFLFIAGPITDIIGRMDAVTSISISMTRIRQFEETLKANLPVKIEDEQRQDLKEPFEQIRFEQVSYQYLNTDQTSSFKLKPIDLTIRKGETIFVIGGNGSGKSTFMNLLAALLMPREGKVFYNEHLLDENNFQAYRDKIACIFTDNYLFNENYDKFDFSKDNASFWKLMKQMGLDEVAHIDEEKNTVSTSLSKGQQKRLALILALLEKKEILIFDEWAAEQDPFFRKYFYRTIIPQLKAENKTVIAITHDDAYFDAADRIIKFEYGEVIGDTYDTELSLPALKTLKTI